MPPIITVENLSKRYRLGQIGVTSLRDSVQRLLCRLRGQNPDHVMGDVIQLKTIREPVIQQPMTEGSSPDEFWALRDVSFEVQQGEVLGIIGRNGAGKSTILKLLSRITEPTSGRAIIRGRVASLLEVGTGFHPELSGRENIYLNGSILGMRKGEIDRKFDEIVAFAEMERFIDTPVKRYSSGMYVRLGFSVAAHLEPEILIVDEVLAVGDVAFQKKCLGKMQDVSGQGRTVIFVTHNMAALLNLCPRSILLQAGRLVDAGPSADIVSRYLRPEGKENTFIPEGAQRMGDMEAKIVDFSVMPNPPETEKPVDFVFHVQRNDASSRRMIGYFGVNIKTEQSGPLIHLASDHMGCGFELFPGITRVSVHLDSLPLTSGRYPVGLWLGSTSSTHDWIQDCFQLVVQSGRLADSGRFVESVGYPVSVSSAWRLCN